MGGRANPDEGEASLAPTKAERPLVFAARGLTMRFGKFTAVDGVDLEVRDGDVHALVGAVEEVLRQAGDLSTTAQESVIHENIRRCGAPGVAAARTS